MAPQAAADGGQDYVEGRLLDGFLMLAAGGSSTPDDVVSVNLASLQIVDIADEDLSFFAHLDRVDVSDNQLSYEQVLQQLSSIPRLGCLCLACNAISSVAVPAAALRHLRSLDLSFNELHGDVLGQLAALPRLERLDLSSNCISSVPPEEDLCGFGALEELILDANEMVQFIQWRALDAVPQLKRLSLASNRIKRVKDEAADVPGAGGEGLSYFRHLEELDLSSNEIASASNLSALRLFQSLRVLNLNENPCSKGRPLDDRVLPGVEIKAWAKKPWYLEGSGCFQKRKKPTEPALKLNRRRMRKVRSMQDFGAGRRRRRERQVAVLDEGTNSLVVALPGDALTPPRGGAPRRGLAVGAEPGPAPLSVLDDELSEEELEEILRERRAKIDQDFKASVDEPRSFMRHAPFPEDDLARCWPAPPPGQAEESSVLQSSGLLKRSSSNLFLTGLGEDASEAAAAPRPAKPGGQPSPAASPPPPAGGGGGGGGVRLPPLEPGSRGSSADGALAKPRMAMPDVGVREALRALRAAAMSEYAVAA